jgi:TPR repeat protein
MKYLRRSAEHGYTLAQVTLGERCRDGVNVSKDVQTAKYWFKASASAGGPSGVLALCDLAIAEHDVEQCRECLELENRAIAIMKPKSSEVLQLQRQQGRVRHILRQPNRP